MHWSMVLPLQIMETLSSEEKAETKQISKIIQQLRMSKHQKRNQYVFNSAGIGASHGHLCLERVSA